MTPSPGRTREKKGFFPGFPSSPYFGGTPREVGRAPRGKGGGGARTFLTQIKKGPNSIKSDSLPKSKRSKERPRALMGTLRRLLHIKKGGNCFGGRGGPKRKEKRPPATRRWGRRRGGSIGAESRSSIFETLGGTAREGKGEVLGVGGGEKGGLPISAGGS